MNREKFIEDVYEYADEELKVIYDQQKNNENELLNEIAMILLTYTVVDSVLSLTSKEKTILYSKLSKLVLNMFGKETKKTTKVITSILASTVEKDLKYYKVKSHKDFVLKLINEHYKGKHFSDRIWDNENDVSKMLHKEIKDFLDGKVNVNQIKSHIENQFKANKYNVKRLVDDQIAQLESKVTEKYFKDYNIKKVKYNACLCNTCEKCLADHERIFDVDDKDRPSLPRHVQCKCFYVQED